MENIRIYNITNEKEFVDTDPNIYNQKHYGHIVLEVGLKEKTSFYGKWYVKTQREINSNKKKVFGDVYIQLTVLLDSENYDEIVLKLDDVKIELKAAKEKIKKLVERCQ